MKKYLPIILFIIGLLVLGGVFFFLRRGGSSEVESEENVPDIPFGQRPVTSLTPSEDGHWLYLSITDITFPAETVDYELLYKLPDGRTQGVPGTVKLSGGDIERELLLGSESSGKFRYDEGVKEGTLTLRFRNDKGKLTGKLTTDFHLQTDTDTLTSVDSKFKFVLDEADDNYYVVMSTFGSPSELPGDLKEGPYGVFTSSEGEINGMPELIGDTYRFEDGGWQKVEDSSQTGIFVSTKPQEASE